MDRKNTFWRNLTVSMHVTVFVITLMACRERILADCWHRVTALYQLLTFLRTSYLLTVGLFVLTSAGRSLAKSKKQLVWLSCNADWRDAIGRHKSGDVTEPPSTATPSRPVPSQSHGRGQTDRRTDYQSDRVSDRLRCRVRMGGTGVCWCYKCWSRSLLICFLSIRQQQQQQQQSTYTTRLAVLLTSPHSADKHSCIRAISSEAAVHTRRRLTGRPCGTRCWDIRLTLPSTPLSLDVSLTLFFFPEY